MRAMKLLTKLFHVGIIAVFLFGLTDGFCQQVQKQSPSSLDKYLELGTNDSQFGGDDVFSFDRRQIGNQIKTFIPPLLAPAFTQHAYVLPPGSMRVDVSQRAFQVRGDDFFRNGDPNEAVFRDFEVDRQLLDLDFFYGFDFDKKYLHSFTLRINIPYQTSETDGSVHPNGQQFISLENAGTSSGIGDIGIFVKKKIFDQGNSGFGLAAVAAVFLPTGANDNTFGSNGRITARRPTPPNNIVAQGFDALQQANVSNNVWGDPRCFFRNFNLANRSICNNNPTFSAPAAFVQSFEPQGANFDTPYIGDFPFNNGVFGRFSADGRMPAILQSGTGSTSYFLGTFFSRQFDTSSFTGRSAFHAGITHKFVSASDGIDPGDITTFFMSFVKPLYQDFISVDLSFVGFDREDDSYAGKIPEPEIHECDASDIGVVASCNNIGDDVFVFELADRPPFSGGLTGFVAPSLIFSPNPQLRLTLSALIRVVEPDLGPAPENVIRLNFSSIF